jgi:hypothetical protein
MACKSIVNHCKCIIMTGVYWGFQMWHPKNKTQNNKGLFDIRGIFSDSPSPVDLKNMVCMLFKAHSWEWCHPAFCFPFCRQPVTQRWVGALYIHLLGYIRAPLLTSSIKNNRCPCPLLSDISWAVSFGYPSGKYTRRAGSGKVCSPGYPLGFSAILVSRGL